MSTAETLNELSLIQSLLLTPTAMALRECERKLLKVINAITESADGQQKSPHLKQMVQDIHRLLENASRFWDCRCGRTSMPRQYSADGSLSSDGMAPMFVIEV